MDVNVRKLAAYVPVTQELLADVDPPLISAYLAERFDRYLRPWAYPDKPIRWTVALFPRWLDRLLDWWDRR